MSTDPRILIPCINCTCMSGAFRMLTNEQLMRVDLHRREIHYKKGETLCKQGSFMSNMMFVKDGLVKLYMENNDHPTIISLEGDGHFIGLPLIFGEGHPVYHYTATAVTETDICQVNIELFKEFISENHGFAQQIIRMLSEEVIKGHKQMFGLTQKQIRGRFAELVLHLKENIYKSSKMKMTISRKDMAELISTSQESISRLIKEFNDEKITEINGNHLHILDLERLQYISRVG